MDALAIFEPSTPRLHILGLAEKICNAFAPKLQAISSADVISPAIEVCIPMRMLPSIHAGGCGFTGGSGRYSSPGKYGSDELCCGSSIPSECVFFEKRTLIVVDSHSLRNAR